MGKLIRIALLGILLVTPTVGQGRCPESNDIQCGSECVFSLPEGGYCALVVTPDGQTSETMACMDLIGGCISHDNDCHCGGNGSF